MKSHEKTEAVGAIEAELKKLLAEQQSAEASVKEAGSALAKSQGELNAAKARETTLSQRLLPLQQLARELGSSGEAVKKQRESAIRDIEEAEKLHANMFPTIYKEISAADRQALDDAEADRGKSEQAREALRQEIEQTETAQSAARAEAAAAQVRIREVVAELGSLAKRIESARGRVAERLASARNSFAAGKPGEAFLALRELEAQRAELAKLAAEDADKELLKEIDAAHTKAAKSAEKATQAPVLEALKQKLAAAEADLEGKRKAAKDARAVVAANQTARSTSKLASPPAS